MFKRNRPINKISKKKKVKVNDKSQGLNKVKHDSPKVLEDVILKRYIFIIVIIFLCFGIIGVRLFSLQILSRDEYTVSLERAVEKRVESASAPRGRIYDRNYNLLVDNVAVKTIYYKKENNITTKEEVELAYKVADLIEVDYSSLTDYRLKNFWYVQNKEDAKKKITDKEWKLNKERKLSDDDIVDLIFERISEEELSKFDDRDKEAAYIYYLMNKGYSYAEKVIKSKDITEKEYAVISENIDVLHGFNTKLDWERVYLYGDTFKSILGSVSSDTQGIPSELAEYYLDNGYSLADRVGISYLEYQYENYLKGTKAIYKVLPDNTYVLTSEVMNAKGEVNTEYYNRSFAVVSDPNTGEILAMGGKQIREREDGSRYIVDYTPGIVTLPVTPGSIVKGASMLVGYKYGAINIGDTVQDDCIKIKDTPEKCSWKKLGLIDDVDALRMSSNYYQYLIAIKIGNGTYNYNEALKIDTDAFKKYRDMYSSFGLGVKTGIDLPIESLGYTGKSTLPGHLLDFAIGQYDTYTPIQLSQYINTLANGGTRLKPYLLKEVYSQSSNDEDMFGELIYKTDVKALGKVDVDSKYIDRVKYGFNRTVVDGLGNGYMGYYTNSGGKTGTSQSFIDTDGDNVVDTETITTSFVGYSPADNPKMSIVVVSPDISNSYGDVSYTSPATKRISAKIVNKYFEIYK